MQILDMIGAIIMIVVSLLIILLVTLQDSKGDGISALAGANAFLNSNNDRSVNARLVGITKILAIVFFVITLAVYAINVYLV